MAASNESSIADFCAITGAETDVAKAFLKACSWNSEIAMNRYFEFNGDVSKLAPSSNIPPTVNANVQPQHPQGTMSNSANAIAQALGGFFGGGGVQSTNPINNNGPSVHQNIPMPSTQSSTTSSFAVPNGSGFLTQEEQDALLAQQLASQSGGAQPQQDFVRAPDRVVTDRLVGPYVNQFGSSRFQQQRDLQQLSREYRISSTFIGELIFKLPYQSPRECGCIIPE